MEVTLRKLVQEFVAPKPPKAVGPRRYRAIASTDRPDRVGDRILSWDLSQLKSNAPLLWSHDPKLLVGSIRAAQVERRGDHRALVVEFELLPEGVSQLADYCASAIESGALRALSVGGKPFGRETANEWGGIDYEGWMIWEISLVALPANADALAASIGGKHVMSGQAPRLQVPDWFVRWVERRQQAFVPTAEQVRMMVRSALTDCARSAVRRAMGRLD